MTCPCENKCAGKNPPAILAIEQPCEPVLFHRVDYPANLGDDTTVDVNTLDYRNVLLVFANGHAYLYSSDGIPTQLVGDAQDVSALKAQIEALGGQLAEEATNRENADTALSNQIASMQTDLGEAVSELQSDVANEALERSEAISDLQEQLDSTESSLNALQNTTVQKDTAVSADASTVTLTKTTGELTTDGTEADLPFPVASETSAGVMNSATYNAVQENAENIDSILGGAVVLQDLPAEPTDEELTTAWKTATGKTELINRASIYDETNKKVWYYYENANAWKPISTDGTEVTISVATNDTAGIVKGSTENGQVAVEADGSMSLNGYDGIQHDIDNLTQLVAGIEVPKVGTYVAVTAEVPSTLSSDWLFTRRTGDGYLMLKRAFQDTTTGIVNRSWNAVVPRATSTADGTMSAKDKSKLDSLLEIKSLNDSLELDENGQLSVVGGGSDVNLLSEYAATVGDNDAYNASYVNSRLDGPSPILFGTATTTKPTVQGQIIIGENITSRGSDSIIIGRNYRGDLNGGCIAIGCGTYSSSVRDIGQGSVTIGYSSHATFSGSVALGARSTTGRVDEVSIGSVGGGATRFLANVTAGTLPTDAVNLQQMQDYVAENAGNPFTEMETTRVKNLPPAVVTGFEDTTYGTDTITMHLDTKDLATGGVSVQELELEGATANNDEAGGHAGLMTAFQATQLAALAEGGAGGLTPAEVTKVQNLGSGSLTNMDGVLQTEEAVEIEFSRQNLVAGGTTTQTATIAAATTEEAGVMTPAMVAQLNQIGDIATVLETLTTGAGV